MKELQDILQKIAAFHKTGRPVALATVVKVGGSTYRNVGARMLISPDSKTTGTISGGCLEGDVLQRGLGALAAGRPEMITYDTTSEDDIFWGTGMGCGGKTSVFIQPLSASDYPVFETLAEKMVHHQPVVLLTILRPAPDSPLAPGRHLLFDNNGNLIETPAITPETAPERAALGMAATNAFNDRQSRMGTVETAAGAAEVFINYLAPAVPLVIFGGEHDVLPLLSLAKSLGWHVSVVDRRAHFLIPERFPAADALFHWDCGAPPAQLVFTERTVAVVMTHNFLADRHLLRYLLASPAAYTGILGPKNRTDKLLTELSESGLTLSKNQRQRIYSPVGLDIGAETPEEVALAIIAEIQTVLQQRSGRPLRDRDGSIHDRKD